MRDKSKLCLLLIILILWSTGCQASASKALPQIEGIEDIYVVRGNSVDYREGIRAYDNQGEDITDRIVVDASKIKLDECGEYVLTYTVEDDEGNKLEEVCLVNVVEGEEAMATILEMNRPAFVYIVSENDGEKRVGCGFIIEIDEEGIYLMTNAHVVAKEQAEIIFYEGFRASGEVLARQNAPDMAIIRVEPEFINRSELESLRKVEIDRSYWDSLDPGKLPAAGYSCLNEEGMEQRTEVGRILHKEEEMWAVDYPVVQYSMENVSGASGSAVIDESGKLIAMVLGVSREEDTLSNWGIGLPDLIKFYEGVTGKEAGY